MEQARKSIARELHRLRGSGLLPSRGSRSRAAAKPAGQAGRAKAARRAASAKPARRAA
jgi:hypothetical protein